jgi:hypothetical protein
MSNPPVFFTRQDGKLALCLSRAAQWFAGVFATLVGAGTIWFFSLTYTAAENSRQALLEIKHLSEKLDLYKADTNERLKDLKAQVDKNDERDFKVHGREEG